MDANSYINNNNQQIMENKIFTCPKRDRNRDEGQINPNPNRSCMMLSSCLKPGQDVGFCMDVKTVQ